MTDIPINDVTRRVQFTGNTTTGPFNFTFEILTAADVEVYKNNTKQTLTTHYTVTINSNGTGFVTMGSALVSSDVLTIIGGRAISRTTDFVTAGDLLASSLNEQLDSLVIMNQQLSEKIDRTIIANPGDTRISSLTLPLAANRASKLVSFDADGDLLVDSSSNLNLVLGTVTISTILGSNDIALKPAGGQVNILGTSGEQRFAISNGNFPTIQMFSTDGNSVTLALPSGNPTAARTVRFPDANGTVALTNQNTMTTTGDFTVDASGDIVLDADGSQVYLKDNGTTRFTFQLGSPQIQANGTGLQISNSSSSIDFKSANSIYDFLTSTGNQAIQLLADSTPQIQYYQNSNTLRLEVASLDGSRTLTLPNATDTLVGKATTDTLTNKTLTSPVLNSSVSGTAIKDEDNMSSNSPNHLATQQSIKAYVDSSIASSGDITGVVAGTGMTGGGTSGTVSLNINATTGLTATSSTISIDSTVVTKTGSHTLTNKTLTSPVLNTGVSGTAIKDEDNFASNSATHLATQQSIKAYVDGQVAGGGAGNLSTVLGIGNTTAGNNIVFGDSSGASDDRLVFGAGSDLQIYHDGSHSYIEDSGTGNLRIDAQSFQIRKQGTTENMAGFAADGAVSLYHDNALKFATTSTGVDVKNVASGANAKLNITTESTGGGTSEILFSDNTTGRGRIYYDHGSSPEELHIETTGTDALVIDNSQNVSIPNGNVGIGSSTPSNLLHVEGAFSDTSQGVVANFDSGNAGIGSGPIVKWTNDFAEAAVTMLNTASGSSALTFETMSSSSLTERMRISSSGNVGIGNSSPSYLLSLSSAATTQAEIKSTATNGTAQIRFTNDARTYTQGVDNNDNFFLYDATGSASRLTVDTSGNVAIGRSANISHPLDIQKATDAYIRVSNATTQEAAGIIFANQNTSKFTIEKSGSAHSLFIKDASGTVATFAQGGDVSIGTSSSILSATGRGNLTINGTSQSILNLGTNGGQGVYLYHDGTNLDLINTKNGYIRFAPNNAEAMRIESSGNLVVGETTAANVTNGTGVYIASSNGQFYASSSSSHFFNKQADGDVLIFRSAGTSEGSVSISGSTTSYNGGHLSRWSQLADGSKDTNIVKGTVMTNLDKMAVWTHAAIAEGDEFKNDMGETVTATADDVRDAFTEDNEQLNCMAVSSVEGDPNVAGVFVNWDNDDDFNDMNIAMTGDMVIRIAKEVTIARGDLLMSAGDGTAKPQEDDIVRSKTIAKVTSTNVSHTYDDGSYCVPCVLMAC